MVWFGFWLGCYNKFWLIMETIASKPLAAGGSILSGSKTAQLPEANKEGGAAGGQTTASPSVDDLEIELNDLELILNRGPPGVYTVQYTIYTVQYTLYTVQYMHCAHFTVHCVHRVQYTVYTMYSTLCTLYSILCTLYCIVHCVHYTVHCVHCPNI